MDIIGERAYALNCIWSVISLIILLAAIAVGRETKQIRHSHRVAACIPVTVYDYEGNSSHGVTQDVSMGGVAIHMPWRNVTPDQPVQAVVHAVLDGEVVNLPATMIRSVNGKAVFTWNITSLSIEAAVVRFVFGRADAWLQWNDYENDQPLRSLWSLIFSIKALFRKRGQIMAHSRPQNKPVALPVERREPTSSQGGQKQEGKISRAAS